MKNKIFPATFALLPLLSVGAFAAPALVLDPVGPETHTHNSTAPAEGTLMVFSGVEVHQSSDPTNDYRQYSDYEIWSADGAKRVQLVRNHQLPFTDDKPAPVKLAAGRYLVKARGNFYNVSVPVVIGKYRVTTVHLDGKQGPGLDKAHASPDLVYLPDGSVVGPRAPAES